MNDKDHKGEAQGEWMLFYNNNQLKLHCNFKDNEYYGEVRLWSYQGMLREWMVCYQDNMIIDFMKNPELYPMEEDRTMFALQVGLPLLPPMENNS